jgi:hypothetical protein
MGLRQKPTLKPDHTCVEESKIANLGASKTPAHSLPLRENAVKPLLAAEFEHPLGILGKLAE